MSQQLILVVEDDEFVTGLLTDVLRAAGYVVATAESAFGVASRIRELQPCALILDLGLPFRPGSALLDELRADPRIADVPVIVITGLIEALTQERRALATAVFSKPFDLSGLLDVIHSAAVGKRD